MAQVKMPVTPLSMTLSPNGPRSNQVLVNSYNIPKASIEIHQGMHQMDHRIMSAQGRRETLGTKN
jgi:hypothetical protein